MISDIAVRRPVLAMVAAILLCVIGAAAFFTLPVRELPNVDPPIVSVSTNYTGASAEVVESRITEVLERQIAGIQGVNRVTSSSRDGQSRISIEFNLSRNIDDAANDIRDAVSRVSNQLPDEADAPQIAKADADASPMMILFFSSRSLSRLQLTDYADRYLVERLSTVPGVAQASLGGDQTYAMRVWLNADALAARGLTVTDVANALRAQNAELPAGSLESQTQDFTIRIGRNYATPEQFAQLPITAGGLTGGRTAATGATATGAATGAAGAANTASAGGTTATGLATTPGANITATAQTGYVVRLGDVARVEEGAAERRRVFRGNGVDQVAILITRQSQANDLDISHGVRDVVASAARDLPPGSELVVAVDNSTFTSDAIHEVYITIGLSILLVSIVNFLFLGTLRAAFIPSIVAPICLLSAFIVLAVLGFSVNLLTLLALVLAIGLVVDDAIVVTENVQRRIDDGEPPVIAAERGTRQVFFAVVATTVVLLSVFAPLMFLPGQIGRLFVELAVAIAGAVFFSAFLAFTLSPMLASKILRKAKTEGLVARTINRGMGALTNSYRATLNGVTGTAAGAIAMGVLVIVVGAAAFGLYSALPEELVPPEDRGRVDIQIQAPVGAGFDYTARQALQLEPVFERYRRSGVAERYLLNVPGFGGGTFNNGSGAILLVPSGQRSQSADQVAASMNREFGRITGARVTASVRGPFQRGGGGGGGGTNVDFIVSGPEYEALYDWIQPVLADALNNPGFARPRLDYEPTSPRVLVNVDRERAAALGVSPADVGAALQTMFGSARVTTYIRGGQEYDVLLQAELPERRTVENLQNLYVRAGTGSLVPLSSLVTTETRGDTPSRARLNRLRAITLTTQLNPGYTAAEAIAWFEQQARQRAPSPVVQWGGQARDLLESSGSVGVAFGLALLLVFLVLAAQFESWITPAVIMLTVPLAAAGGLFGLFMAGSTLNIYSEIGLIILVGIAAKNGILIVEFANQLRDEGMSIKEAIVEASALRLRPIIMTSVAAAMGALPLVLYSGAGAGSRQTIGVVIFVGAIFATLLTLFVVPVIYSLLARFTRSPEWTRRIIEGFEKDETTREHGGAVPAPAE